MMAKAKRKVTMDKSRTGKEADSPPKRQSVFDRLGPGSSAANNSIPQPKVSDDWQEKCRNWLRHGTCQFGNKCKYQHEPSSKSGNKSKDRTKDKEEKSDSNIRSKVSAKRAGSPEKSRTPSPKRTETRQRRSRSRSSRGEHDGKIKSQVVVTQRPSSAATVSSDKRRSSRSWAEDAGRVHLDFEEELTLEKKRQELQRELELEMQKEQKEKLLQSKRENVIINKVITTSSSDSSSSSSSGSSSSSSSSKSSSSSDDDDVASSASSRIDVSRGRAGGSRNPVESRKKGKERRSKSGSGEETRKVRHSRDKVRRRKKSKSSALGQNDANATQMRAERLRGDRSHSGSLSRGAKQTVKEDKGKSGTSHYPKKRLTDSLVLVAERSKSSSEKQKHRKVAADQKNSEKHPHKKKKPKERVADPREDAPSRSSSRVRDAPRDHTEAHRKSIQRPNSPVPKETKKGRRKLDSHSPSRKTNRRQMPAEDWPQVERVPPRASKKSRSPVLKEGNFQKSKQMAGNKALVGSARRKAGNRMDKDRNVNMPSLFVQKHHGIVRRQPLMAKKLAAAAAGAAKKRALEKSLRAVADNSRIAPLFAVRAKATKKDKGMFRRGRIEEPCARDQRMLVMDHVEQRGRAGPPKLIPDHVSKESDHRRSKSGEHESRDDQRSLRAGEKERTWESIPRRAPLSPQFAVFAEWERAEREREKSRDRMRIDKDRDRGRLMDRIDRDSLDKGRNLSAERRVGRDREAFGHRSYESHPETFEYARRPERDRPASPQPLMPPRSPEQRRNTNSQDRSDAIGRRQQQDTWDGKRGSRSSHGNERADVGDWRTGDEDTRSRKRSRDHSREDIPPSKRIRVSPPCEDISTRVQQFSGHEGSESGSVKSKRTTTEVTTVARDRHKDKVSRVKSSDRLVTTEGTSVKLPANETKTKTGEGVRKVEDSKHSKKRQNSSPADGTETKKRRKADPPLGESTTGVRQADCPKVPSVATRDSDEKSVSGDAPVQTSANLSDWSDDSDDLLNRLEDQQRLAEAEREREKDKDKEKEKDKDGDEKEKQLEPVPMVTKRRERSAKKTSPFQDNKSGSVRDGTKNRSRGRSREESHRSRRHSREVNRLRSTGTSSRCNSGERQVPISADVEPEKLALAPEKEESADKLVVVSSSTTVEDIPNHPEAGKDNEDSLQSDGKCVAGETNDYDPISDEELEAILEDSEDINWQKSTDQSEAKPGIIDALEVDWSSLTNSKEANKPEDLVPVDVLQRFGPVNILTRIGISANLLGEEKFEKIRAKCQLLVFNSQTHDANNKLECEQEFKMEHNLAAFHALAVVKKKERATIFDSFGPHRRALCARRDLEIRRRLCNFHDKDQGSLPTASDSDVFCSAVQLFKFGKLVPAT